MPVDLESDLRKWGNSIGVIIPARVAKRYGLKAGQHVRLHLEVDLPRNDPDRLPTWNLGGQYDIDHEVEDELGDRYDATKRKRET